MARYRLSSTEARVDGSGEIKFEVWALNDDSELIGPHIEIPIPASVVDAAIGGPTPGASLVAALREYAPVGWSNEELDEAAVEKAAKDAANENAAAVDVELDAYIVDTFPPGYPVDFNA